MTLSENIGFVRELIDSYAVDAFRMGVALEDPADRGVPVEMQVGEVNEEGWVQWRVLPSTLSIADVVEMEKEIGAQFPPLFRAYLLARFHLFDQVVSQRYSQQIFMTHTPSLNPLKPLCDLIEAWKPLLDAGFIPFAQWGDGWGPMCFDSTNRDASGDCPIAWMDHESLITLGANACRSRECVQPFAQPLYESCREFLLDVFVRDTS